MRTPLIAPATLLVVAATLAACSPGTSADSSPSEAPTVVVAATSSSASPQASPSSSSSATAEPLTQSSSSSEASTSGCLSEDSSLAPGGYCIYPAKVQWLSSDVLTVDPETLDWTDPDAVANAYAITLNTWDSREDASGAYASRRAAIFTEQGRTVVDTTDPDTARGQAEFTTTWQSDSYATVTINSITTESPTGEALQADGSWLRVVDYTRTVHTRDDDKDVYVKEGFLFLTLNQDVTTGEWLVTDSTLAQEVDLSD